MKRARGSKDLVVMGGGEKVPKKRTRVQGRGNPTHPSRLKNSALETERGLMFGRTEVAAVGFSNLQAARVRLSSERGDFKPASSAKPFC